MRLEAVQSKMKAKIDRLIRLRGGGGAQRCLTLWPNAARLKALGSGLGVHGHQI